MKYSELTLKEFIDYCDKQLVEKCKKCPFYKSNTDICLLPLFKKEFLEKEVNDNV